MMDLPNLCRQDSEPSVTEDDLFGDGRKSNDGNLSDAEGGLLPHFSMFENSSASDASSRVQHELGYQNSKDIGSGSGNESFESFELPPSLSDGDRKDSFKSVYLGSRSISDAGDKRKRYSSSKVDINVFEDPPEGIIDLPADKRCNSLPDLISSPNAYCSTKNDYPKNPSPDVTLQESDHDSAKEQRQEEKRKLTVSLEGPSTKNASSKRKHKPPLRSVSFSGQNEVFGACNDEGFDEIEEKIEGSEPSTPISKTGQHRRQVFSESSGFCTGSEGSQDKPGAAGSFQSQKSQGGVSDVSSTFTSNDDGTYLDDTDDTEKGDSVSTVSQKKFDVQNSPEVPIQKVEHEATCSSYSEVEKAEVQSVSGSTGNDLHEGADSGSTYSGSSFNTVIDTRKRDSAAVTTSGMSDNDLPSKETDNSYTFGPLVVDPKFSSMNRLANSSFSSQQTGSSAGNVPNLNLLDESFTLSPECIEKVAKDDSLARKKVVRRYCRNSADQSLGVQQSSHSSHASSSDGSGSLSHIGPKSRTLQEFENILGDIDRCNNMHEIIERIQQISSLNSSPSSSPYLIGGRNKSSSSPKLVFSSLHLERSSRCSKKGCPDQSCQMLAEVKAILLVDLPEVQANFEYVKQFCELLWRHSPDCDEIGCKIPFCKDLSQWDLDDLDINKMVQLMQTRMKDPFMSSLYMEDSIFLKISDDTLKGRKPKDFETHIPLCPLGGEFGSAKLYLDKETRKQCVIQQHPLFDYKHQLSLYTRLVNLQHPHVATQLWLLEFNDTIQVCSQFVSGGSLKDLLDTGGELRWGQVVYYLRQIIPAVEFLHDNGIIYLYWISDNILFEDGSRRHVKLSNFSLSYPPGHVCDLGATKACLPYNICPPELLEEQAMLVFESDCWGIGCLVSEMLTARPVWDDLRHEGRDVVHRQIHQTLPNIHPTLSTEQKHLLTACWQRHPKHRKPLSELHTAL